MNTAESAIEIHDLYRQYDDFTAVNGISLCVARGETFGLLGTNGAGKTSTLEGATWTTTWPPQPLPPGTHRSRNAKRRS
ncbi:ATP-binding cassette domain-containing protein [Corynebacterium simulans]|uniref:ATP-binding cassette domain-containing protein n=1 Tax=Corynebacterium simulans TaxID=146827 RepID=UPI0030B85080